MSREYFDWSTIEEDIVIPEQAAIAVYCNPKGKVVLRQAGQYGPDEDTWITFDKSHALTLARAILDRADLEMAIVPLTAQNSGGETLAPFRDQETIDAVRNAGRIVDLIDNDEAPADRKKRDKDAERQRRRRERQRQRDSHSAERDMSVTERDSERDVTRSPPTTPQFDLQNGGAA
jgi:hypothetical protein